MAETRKTERCIWAEGGRWRRTGVKIALGDALGLLGSAEPIQNSACGGQMRPTAGPRVLCGHIQPPKWWLRVDKPGLRSCHGWQIDSGMTSTIPTAWCSHSCVMTPCP